MRLHFAYTPKAITDAFDVTKVPASSQWYRAGHTPMMFAQSSTGSFLFKSGDDLYVNTGYMWVGARIYDLLTTLADDEVVTYGCRMYAGNYSTRYSADFAGILTSGGTVYPLQHLDVVDNAVNGIAFVEISIDPAARTVTGYVNGKKIRAVTYAASYANSFGDVEARLANKMNASVGVYMRDFYCGVFKKSEGPTILTAWSCEDLVEISNDLRDGDGALTRNQVSDAIKTITWKAPEPGAHVAIDLTGINPQLAAKLTAQISDGKTTSTKELSNIQSLYVATGALTKYNSGRAAGAINPSADATQITLKVRAQYMQE